MIARGQAPKKPIQSGCWCHFSLRITQTPPLGGAPGGPRAAVAEGDGRRGEGSFFVLSRGAGIRLIIHISQGRRLKFMTHQAVQSLGISPTLRRVLIPRKTYTEPRGM